VGFALIQVKTGSTISMKRVYVKRKKNGRCVMVKPEQRYVG
jgi:hypothetical protein